MLADVICYWKMMSFIALDGITTFLHLKDVTIAGKQIRVFVDKLYEDKSLALHAGDLIFTTDLQTVNYYSTIHC